MQFDPSDTSEQPALFDQPEYSDFPKVWTNVFGSSESESVYALAAGDDGSVYAGGVIYGSLGENHGFSNHDAFITKYKSDGTREWIEVLDDKDDDRIFTSIAHGGKVTVKDEATGKETEEEIIYVAGYLAHEVGEDFTYDGYLAKYNSAGEVKWTQLLGSTPIRGTAEYEYSPDGASEGETYDFSYSYDYITSVATAPDGSVYVSGITEGNLDGHINPGYSSSVLSEYEEDSNDAFIAKYTADGIKLWTKQFGSSGEDEALSVAVDSTGAVYVSGATDIITSHTGGIGTVGQNTGETIESDYFVSKYSPDGEKIWTELLGTNGFFYPAARAPLTIGNDDSIYVGVSYDRSSDPETLLVK